MKTVLTCLSLWLGVSGITTIETASAAESAADQLAKGFVSLLAQGEFQKATDNFDDNMKAALPPGKLEATWKSQLTASGDYQKIETVRVETVQQYQIVFVTCRFQKQRLDVRVVIDKANKVAGLFFQPAGAPYRTPAYANTNLFLERDVSVGTGEWVLPGTLSMPAGKGPFPAVVLVHGSGPHDKDESIGPNKPFQDLAWGLASRGIAVLRYEKRTHRYAARMAEMKLLTVREETIADAIEAVNALQKTAGIDPSKIFILGHSLGGMVAPRIAAGKPDIAGLVILAGPTRPLEDLVLEQTMYQASLSGENTPDAKQKVEEIKRQVAAVKNLSKKSIATNLLFGAPASYWLDLNGYNPGAVAKALKQPMLILQGERDCQVTMADFKQWREMLSSRADVVLKSYPTLNHLFMEVPGQSTGAEYQQAGNVAGIVVNDIAEWIAKH